MIGVTLSTAIRIIPVKIFIDTAVIDDIKEAAAWGIVDGVTTNPSLVAKTGKKLSAVVDEILEVVNGPISVEVLSTSAQDIIAEGKEIAAVHPNIVVRCPMTPDGVQATKALSSEGIKVNVTLVFSAMQALLAAKAGATYVSPFVGRIDDTSTEGMTLIEDIAQIFAIYNMSTEILAASLRHPMHVLQSALAGAHVSTLPPKVLKQLFHHPLTDIGLAKFLKDAENIPR